MSEKGNIDPTLRVLGGQARYQLMQLIVVSVGSFGASYQLLDNIFIGEGLLPAAFPCPVSTCVCVCVLSLIHI